MMNRRGILLFFLTLLYSEWIFSQSFTSHLTVQQGAYLSAPGTAQHVDIVGLIGDQFTVNRRYNSNALVNLGYFIGNEQFDSGQPEFSYGANFFFLPSTSVSGNVIQENLFTNLSYRYRLAHYPIYLTAKIKNPISYSDVSFTADAGIGPNFMRTSGFSEQSLDGGITIPETAFSGRTSTTFSATVGLGLQVARVFGDISMECGFRFFYLGQGQLSRTTDQIVNNLHTGQTYANAVLCGVVL